MQRLRCGVNRLSGRVQRTSAPTFKVSPAAHHARTLDTFRRCGSAPAYLALFLLAACKKEPPIPKVEPTAACYITTNTQPLPRVRLEIPSAPAPYKVLFEGRQSGLPMDPLAPRIRLGDNVAMTFNGDLIYSPNEVPLACADGKPHEFGQRVATTTLIPGETHVVWNRFQGAHPAQRTTTINTGDTRVTNFGRYGAWVDESQRSISVHDGWDNVEIDKGSDALYIRVSLGKFGIHYTVTWQPDGTHIARNVTPIPFVQHVTIPIAASMDVGK